MNISLPAPVLTEIKPYAPKQHSRKGTPCGNGNRRHHIGFLVTFLGDVPEEFFADRAGDLHALFLKLLDVL